MDDAGLKQMVHDLLRKAVVGGAPSTSSADGPAHKPTIKKAVQAAAEAEDHIDVVSPGEEEVFDERWADEQGIIFADDLVNEDDSTLMINEEGQLCTVGKGDRPPATHSSSSIYGAEEGYPPGVALGSQTVQCPECFKP